MPQSEVVTMSLTAQQRIVVAVRDILGALHDGFGLDISDPNFDDTPDRVARAYSEIFSGVRDTDAQVDALVRTSFPGGSDEMVVVTDIETFSVCPHHFFPVFYNVSVAYIPSPEGNVLGLSKLPRIVDVLARRPVLQEKFTRDITSAFMRIPGCIGAAASVRGKHHCMMMRGVKKTSAQTVTSSLMGAFRDESSTRAEFLSLVRKS